MDPVIAKLNQQAAQRIQKDIGSRPMPPSSSPSFDKVFDNRMAEKMVEKMRENFGLTPQQEMTVLSAENVQVTTKNTEMGGSSSMGERYYGMFREMNRDLLSLDSAIETLSTPGIKINARQMLAFQAGIGSTMLMTEAFSRFVEGVNRGIQTVVQTQV